MEIVGDTSSHLRSIGDRFYTTNQNIVDGKVQDLTEDEIADFQEQLENKLQSNLVIRNFLVTLELFLNTKCSLFL